jgi:predicted dehydrogenase
MLGVGIIGGGRVAHAHARATAANGATLSLRGIAEVDAERAAALGERYDCPSYTDYHDLLAQPDVNVVTIALPNVLHASAAMDAIAAGKHVFVEKPMALTLEECDAMIAAAEKARVKLMVGHTQHFFALNLAAHRLLSEGELGPLAMLTDAWYKPFGLSFRLPWFLDRAQGGGMWQMNGAHMVDRMIWFSGSPVVAVKAFIGNPLLKQAADDSALAFLQHANGLCSTVAHAGYQAGNERWEGEFVCADGMLKLSTFPPNAGLWVARSERYEPVDVAPNDPFGLEFELFARSILDDTPEPFTPAYARHVVEVLLAAEESARTGREVLL